MKQEKQVKSYTRRTKSGKTVTVKAHTAKYEAADKKDASKKKGAGKEFEERKDSFLLDHLMYTDSNGLTRADIAIGRPFKVSKQKGERSASEKQFIKKTDGSYELVSRSLDKGNGAPPSSVSLKGYTKSKLPKAVREQAKALGLEFSPKSGVFKKIDDSDTKTKGHVRKSTPTKVDVGKSVMNLPTKKIPAYPVKSKWGRMSARQIKDARSIMEQNGVSQKEAIKSVMFS